MFQLTSSPHDSALLRGSKQASRRGALWRSGHMEIKNLERWAECGMWRSRHARAVVPSDGVTVRGRPRSPVPSAR